MRNYFFILCFYVLLYACNLPSTNDLKKKSVISKTNAIGCSPEISDKSWYSTGKKAPFFKELSGLHFSITTKNSEAQKYFDQGLMLSFGFNHAEAGRSFFEGARQDSNSAMCWWGFAYVLGPNYNAGMEKDNFLRAYDAVQKAKQKAASCTQIEKDLINALSHRYSNDTTISRFILDSSYAAEMRNVYQKYPENATIASLFSESLLDLHPWNLFTKNGNIQPWTPEIISVLKKALQIDSLHMGANHLFIHATEMSQQPEMALKSANLLMNLVPGSGHLTHMPSHTYIRTGQYHNGVMANIKAVLIDSAYVDACHAQGVYPLAYYPHNYHFLAACATLSGESKDAIKGAYATANHAHKKLLRDPVWSTLQHYYSIPWYVQVKLGLWNAILRSPAPDGDLKYPLVVWHYSQGMAMLATSKNVEAKKHLSDIKNILKDTTIKKLTIWGINSVYDLCVIASKTLEGEIYAKEKNYPASISIIKEAIVAEDALNYDEPPDWFFSIRHHLGAILIDAGKFKDAISVYEEDLKTYRENGWALKGLVNAYEKVGDRKKSQEIKKRFEKAWQHADINISSSRIL